MSDKPIAFISSTNEDLKAYREAAFAAAFRCGFDPVMMEYWVAGTSRPPVEHCLHKVDQANVVIAIVAHRYGWVPDNQADGHRLSITRLECERAYPDKVILPFVVANDAAWPADQREEAVLLTALYEGKATAELLFQVQERIRLLSDFKGWLRSIGIRKEFASIDGLSAAITDALYAWKEQTRAEASGGRPNPRNYLLHLQRATASMDIQGLFLENHKWRAIKIEDLYIPLTTSSPPDYKPAPLHESLKHRSLIVSGRPGCGKTTFLRWIAFVLTGTLLRQDPSKAERELGFSDPPFPVVVRGAELAAFIASSPATTPRESPSWLPRFLAQRSTDEGWGLNESFFKDVIASGKSLVLVDGLDEVSAGDRAKLVLLLSGLSNSAAVVVTTRTAEFGEDTFIPGFHHAPVDPLDQQSIERFVSGWCAALYSGTQEDPDLHRVALSRALRTKPEIAEMARNPVMLTSLAVLYWNERRLPEQRGELYESIVTWLARSGQDRNERVNGQRTVSVLQELALEMHLHPDGRLVQVDTTWAAEKILGEWPSEDRRRLEAAGQFLRHAASDSGIITYRNHQLRFWHLTFQEFLAARAISSRTDGTQRGLLAGPVRRIYSADWRELVLLYCGIQYRQGKRRVDQFVGAVLDQVSEGEQSSLIECVGLLRAIERELKPYEYTVTDRRYGPMLKTVQEIYEARGGDDLKLWLAAATALGNDPRLAAPGAENWIYIPSGAFQMGAQRTDVNGANFDDHASGDESPVHEVSLEAYYIGKYPVTVDEYRRFVDYGGYDDPRWWAAGGFGRYAQPKYWEKQVLFPTRPVLGVNWFEAAAYCAWVNGRLPTEAEWERAARGKEARKYPWGSKAPERWESHLNSDWRLDHATPVGLYPAGATPEGVCDMGGNVWEWCSDWYCPYEQTYTTIPDSSDAEKRRVARGGSWSASSDWARSSARGYWTPDKPGDDLGFRVVCSSAPRPL